MKSRSPGGPRRGTLASSALVVADVVDQDADGELLVRPTRAEAGEPLLRLAPAKDQRLQPAPGSGDRVLVRLAAGERGETVAQLVKRLGQSAHRVLGVVRVHGGVARVDPVDRRAKSSLRLSAADVRGLADGDLALVRVEPTAARPAAARLLTIVGREDDPRAASLIAQHAAGVPTGFSADALREAASARSPGLEARRDLRGLPLVTIDPADARDHDDAIFAAVDDDPSNTGGWVVWVAIADVAAFVTAGSALDADARRKGNSVYFPDRVEPMLPEVLSAGLCSLQKGEARACLAVRMVFDGAGRKRSHRFERALMRSAASLTYDQAQAAIDGRPDDVTGALLEPVLRPLWGAYAALSLARASRAPLEIVSAERQVVLGKDGRVKSIQPRRTLDANRLVEEFMIQANVCAAETLVRRRQPQIFRVHEAPSRDKLQALKDFLATLSIPWNLGAAARPERFNRLLAGAGPHAEILNEVVLRTQMQAVYSTDNIGHFGLNLDRYGHFTSPIRRYADLTTHRGLIASLNLGGDGASASEQAELGSIAEHVTMTERRAMAAEREAQDRYVAGYLADRVGAEFEASITGVTRFGLFLRLAETGADGLAPISSLGDEYFRHDPAAHCLVGQRTGATWRLGAKVAVRLREASPVTGGLLFEVLSEPEPRAKGARPAATMRPRGRRRR